MTIGGCAEGVWHDALHCVRSFQDDSKQYVRENPTKAVFTALELVSCSVWHSAVGAGRWQAPDTQLRSFLTDMDRRWFRLARGRQAYTRHAGREVRISETTK
jgi:hypothetical protein